MNLYPIDIELLHKALNYFNSLGYEYLSAPLLVDSDVIDHTLPNGNLAKEHIDGLYYVGSAEQSILQLIKDGYSLKSKYMLITPCQRDESTLDLLHLEIFLKVELISFDDSTTIIKDVFNFLSNVVKAKPQIVTVSSTQQDILINGFEVGSYGSNKYKNIEYDYGTGIALPRISQAIVNT